MSKIMTVGTEKISQYKRTKIDKALVEELFVVMVTYWFRNITNVNNTICQTSKHYKKGIDVLRHSFQIRRLDKLRSIGIC